MARKSKDEGKAATAASQEDKSPENVAPRARPRRGGSYVRGADGELTRKESTKAAEPRTQTKEL